MASVRLFKSLESLGELAIERSFLLPEVFGLESHRRLAAGVLLAGSGG